MFKELTIYTDGASKGNPGPASIGASLCHSGKEVANISQAIGYATNNIAEYTALLEALKKAKEMNVKVIHVKADSELMIKQLTGLYRVKNPDIKIIFIEIDKLRTSFEEITFTHVPREENKRADQLANLAL